MMTERQKELVKFFGPTFVEKSQDLLNEWLHIEDCACCVLTDDELEPVSKAAVTFIDELTKCQNIVESKMEEAGVSL